MHQEHHINKCAQNFEKKNTKLNINEHAVGYNNNNIMRYCNNERVNSEYNQKS